MTGQPRRTVTLLTTGGTVSTTTTAGGRSAPTLTGLELAALERMPDIRIVAHELRREPSWALGPSDMAAIALAARDAARATQHGGVVVTHGTTTLEYTAFLADLVLDSDTPVVFTGAMRRADEADPDGPGNLRDAVRVSVWPSARGLGAFVVFAGHIISGQSAWTAQRVDGDAFIDGAGDLGRVSEGSVEIRRRVARRPLFSGRLEKRVLLLKAVPGGNGQPVDAAVASGARGLVLEGLPGSGAIPPAMLDAVARAAARLPVVVASRSPFGTLPEVPTGGTGEPLRGLDLLSAGSLTAEQAWLLLMASLGDGADDADGRSRFRAATAARREPMGGELQ
jgi:L-asparaginase